VLALITQFGGGKTHTLTTLYHLANNGPAAAAYTGIPDLLREAGLASVPKARVAVFVGNAWDPREGRETPWIDIARQLAGNKGVEALGAASKVTAPGTEAIGRVFQAAEAPVLLLFDEVLNFLNRHRASSDSNHVIRFTPRHFRSFNGSGRRCRSTSKHAARWLCWRSGYPLPHRTRSPRRAPNR
jgi:predicted AAA+ superfamily ATPase